MPDGHLDTAILTVTAASTNSPHGSSSGAAKGKTPAVTPEKHYSTGEVMTHTGLSRQTLHNYKRLGLIAPARWTPSGHCFYGEEVFNRLRRIKLYQRYHSLVKIKDLLDQEDGLERETRPAEGQRKRPNSHTPKTKTVSVEPRVAEPVKGEEAAKLARGLMTGEGGSPPPLYRIGDVMRLTGYSRQTLHNYTIQGLIQANEQTASGHRLYGEDVFKALRLIEVLKRHRRFDEVSRLMEQYRRAGKFSSKMALYAPPDAYASN